MIKYLENDFEKEIKDKKILVDFYASWCGPCRMLTEVLESIEDKIDILKVDVDKFPEIARKYGVMSIPNLFLFENNQIIKNQVGFLNENELLDFINEK
ncbi:MAG: thioredoxin [Erysipelotrichaceae bacterium]|nr:thioredoxin [Erysipelotrichaceae bacterium]